MTVDKHHRTALLITLCSLILCASILQAQETRYKARMSVDYMQKAGEPGLLQMSVKYRDENKEYHPANNVVLQVFRAVTEDSVMQVGEVTTSAEGMATFSVEETPSAFLDTIIQQRYFVELKGDERFKKAKKKVDFYYSFLSAHMVEKDSMHYLEATLLDATGEPLGGKKISVQVKRLFGTLDVGDSYYKTDNAGNIEVPLVDKIYSKTGDLTFHVILDHKDFGIVSYEFTAPIGVAMSDQSTYHQRTMWSPPNKTPLFLLIGANALIFGIWFFIILVVYNLTKINKSL